MIFDELDLVLCFRGVFWIGLSDWQHEGEFVWADGTYLSDYNFTGFSKGKYFGDHFRSSVRKSEISNFAISKAIRSSI